MTLLTTFDLPSVVGVTAEATVLGRRMIAAWQRDGVFQLVLPAAEAGIVSQAFAHSRRFFRQPIERKARWVSQRSYSGYVASQEQLIAGEPNWAEGFILYPDLPADDAHVHACWPGHGPVPWPDRAYQAALNAALALTEEISERLLRLLALGLEEPINAFTRLTGAGWHSLRSLRLPPRPSPHHVRGLGANTDAGLLLLAAQEGGGGLYVRPPTLDERRMRNWCAGESSAGWHEHDHRWRLVPPLPQALAVMPGDVMQLMSSGRVLATPLKVQLSTRERFVLTHSHGPRFDAWVRPLAALDTSAPLHYGSHVTRLCMRDFPHRPTTGYIRRLGGLAQLPVHPDQ